MRREQELPHGLRGFVADLHSAGAAVDFSVLYPEGRLVDAPLPTWTHRPLLLTRDGQDSPAHGASPFRCTRCWARMCACRRSPSATCGRPTSALTAQPWLGDHQVHNVAALPGAAYCEMALAAARTVLGEACEVRDIRFEQMLLLDDETPVSAVASVDAPGVADFAVETDEDGERARRASAVLHAAEDGTSRLHATSPPCSRPTRTGSTGPSCGSAFDLAGVQYGPAFAGLAAAHTAEGRHHRVGRGRPARADPLPAGRLRRASSAAGRLLPVRAAHPGVQSAAGGGLLLPLGVRRLRDYTARPATRTTATRR